MNCGLIIDKEDNSFSGYRITETDEFYLKE